MVTLEDADKPDGPVAHLDLDLPTADAWNIYRGIVNDALSPRFTLLHDPSNGHLLGARP